MFDSHKNFNCDYLDQCILLRPNIVRPYAVNATMMCSIVWKECLVLTWIWVRIRPNQIHSYYMDNGSGPIRVRPKQLIHYVETQLECSSKMEARCAGIFWALGETHLPRTGRRDPYCATTTHSEGMRITAQLHPIVSYYRMYLILNSPRVVRRDM